MMSYYCGECNWIGNDETALISPKGITCPVCGCCVCTDHAGEAELDYVMEMPLEYARKGIECG